MKRILISEIENIKHKSCENCKFAFEKKSIHIGGYDILYCRRFPPIRTETIRDATMQEHCSSGNPKHIVSSKSESPFVQRDNWCGEWLPL